MKKPWSDSRNLTKKRQNCIMFSLP